MGIRALFLVVRRPVREAYISPTSDSEVKNTWSYNSIPQYIFMSWYSVKVQGQV